MTAISKEEDGSNKTASLTAETKEILHQSILHYLHRSGFSKTLKRFQSEAHIQNDAWKDSSANLEDIYCKYVNGCHQTKDDIGDTKQDGKDEKTTKSKKKKSDDVEDQSKSSEIPQDNVVVEKTSVTKEDGKDEKTTKSKKKKSDDVEDQSKTSEIPQANIVVDTEIKPKKKKKSKQDLASVEETKEAKSEVNNNEKEANDTKKKPKDKIKKTKTKEEDKPATNTTENGDVHPDVTKEEKKSSKKRKRLVSDENEQKIEAPKEDKVDESDEKPEINEGEKSQKSVKKQRIGSAELKTVNAFQRVKIDQVEFAHEKLQDNSYWAKDGADIGYGAKAQEVLGLVRGKGFRHEKTKKKRGSYRGGQIDLQSHSIKFNYADED